MSSYNTYNISDELVYEDGDVIIRIGTTSNSVFSVHSAVLKKNSSFYHAALSDRWKKPSELLINGTKRQVWEYDMMFDYDLQLPLVNAKEHKINPHRRIMPEDAHRSRSFAKQWSKTSSAEHFSSLLNTHVIQAHMNAYVPPRQFLHNDPQPSTYTSFKYFPEYVQPPEDEDSEDTLMPPRLEANGSGTTYGPFFDAHTRFLPVFCATRNGRTTKRFVAFPNHKAALRHMQAMWRVMLRAFYGLPTRMASGKRLVNNILLIANTAALAEYYGALESILWTLAHLIYYKQPGLGKLISEQPRFFLVLGYRLRSMDIFLDAVKHLAGRIAFACTPTPDGYQYKPNSPSYLDISDFVPQAILDFVEKASKEIEAHYLDSLDRLNDAIQTPPRNGKDGPVHRLARYRIAAFLNGRIIGSRWADPVHDDYEVNRRRTVGPKLIRMLWESQALESLEELDGLLMLTGEAQMFNVDATALCKAALDILQNDPVNALLEEFCNGEDQTSSCFQCQIPRDEDEHIYYDGLGTDPLCPKHGHKAMYHATEYHTNLRTWEVTAEIERDKDTDWILSPEMFLLNTLEPGGNNTTSIARGPPTVSELKQLGILETVTVELDSTAKAKKASRTTARADAYDPLEVTDGEKNLARLFEEEEWAEADLAGRPIQDWSAWLASRRIEYRAQMVYKPKSP